MNNMNQLIKNKHYALQAQVRDWIHLLFHKDSVDTGSSGSATVEATLIFPFFLCAVCTLIVIGQFLLSEASIHHAAMQTVRIYAKQESALQLRSVSGAQGKGNALSQLGGMLETNVILHRYLEKNEANASYVLGGKNGVIFTTKKKDGYVIGNAEYLFRVPVPFFKGILLKRKIQVKCRLFTGYLPVVYEDGGNRDGNSVYVTKYGSVYHTRLDCYHLSISISDKKEIQRILMNSHYRKCKKCMGNSKFPSKIYLTKDGDCYHSSLACSGLKREVEVANRSSVSNQRMCSECAKY